MLTVEACHREAAAAVQYTYGARPEAWHKHKRERRTAATALFGRFLVAHSPAELMMKPNSCRCTIRVSFEGS